MTIEFGGRNVGGEETTRVTFPRFTATWGGEKSTTALSLTLSFNEIP